MPLSKQQLGSLLWGRLTALEDLTVTKEQKNAPLQRLKESLMQNLLTGRIRLPAPEDGKQEP
jgi:hypothetical protein